MLNKIKLYNRTEAVIDVDVNSAGFYSVIFRIRNLILFEVTKSQRIKEVKESKKVFSVGASSEATRAQNSNFVNDLQFLHL